MCLEFPNYIQCVDVRPIILVLIFEKISSFVRLENAVRKSKVAKRNYQKLWNYVKMFFFAKNLLRNARKSKKKLSFTEIVYGIIEGTFSTFFNKLYNLE